MTLFMPHSLSTASAYGLVMTVLLAAYFDWSSWRIPNSLVAGSSVAAIMVAGFGFAEHGLSAALLGGLVGFGLLIPLYGLGGMGAGDVKLMGALGLHAGTAVILEIAVVSAIVGGVWSGLLMLIRSPAGLRLKEMATERFMKSGGHAVSTGVRRNCEPVMKDGSRGSIPYGVVIAIGTLLVQSSAST